MTSQEIQAEMNAQRILLSQSDYEVLKAVEAFFTAASDATGIVGFIQAIKTAVEDITDLLKSRAQWRARYNELEAMTPDDEGVETTEA